MDYYVLQKFLPHTSTKVSKATEEAFTTTIEQRNISLKGISYITSHCTTCLSSVALLAAGSTGPLPSSSTRSRHAKLLLMARLDLKSGSEYWKERERYCCMQYQILGTLNQERVGLGQTGEKVEERRLFCRPSIDVKSDPTGNLYESCDMEKRRENHWTGKGEGSGRKYSSQVPTQRIDPLQTLILKISSAGLNTSLKALPTREITKAVLGWMTKKYFQDIA